MKKFSYPILFGLILFFGFTSDQTQELEKLRKENAELKVQLGPPPTSLDVFYPPKTEMPVYQMQMLELAVPMMGIFVNLMENDMENVMPSFQGFKAKYAEVAKLVPEWEDQFPLAPVEGLGEALQTGEQGKVMAAFDKLGQVCHDCHAANMVKVQQKYYWMDFGKIMAPDPLTNEQVNFATLMQYLDMSFIGIMVDLQEGQLENAVKNFEGFNARFQTLKDTCGDCHGTVERKYYVDENVQAMIDELGMVLKDPSSLDPEKVQGIGMGIGMESCGKCHLVHIPAAYAKLRWNK